MTQEALKLALEALEEIALAGMSGTGQESERAMTEWHARQAWKFIGIAARQRTAIKEALAQPEQEPFFTEANGFPQEFVSKDRQKQAIISMTEQCAALVWERDELQKQVWLYEKNGVTCQTYRHKVEQSCSECNVQMNYTTPPQRKPLTDEEIAEFAQRMEASDPTDSFWREFARAIEAAHGIKE
jgi:nitroreductase